MFLTEINFKLFWLKKIIQVTDSIPWVRCASGNVSSSKGTYKVSRGQGARRRLVVFQCLHEYLRTPSYLGISQSIEYSINFLERSFKGVFSSFCPKQKFNFESLFWQFSRVVLPFHPSLAKIVMEGAKNPPVSFSDATTITCETFLHFSMG